MTVTSKRALDQSRIAVEVISRFAPHQANTRIFSAVCEKLGIPTANTVNTIGDYGNRPPRPFRCRCRLPMRSAGLFQERRSFWLGGCRTDGAAVVLRF
ncbi:MULTISPECIES: 3-oxoacyl-[acyl-carrier-protein] synthase III C-terminal domain-containing protein [Rhizobium]|uniref:3-oxoacyl-[acyl-carrier-protein] synthase III C-terminal domain-containing protein n=1 Tax=Rhizobium TaxID=379 RepID=UPI001EF0BB9E|nr:MULTISPECIES: 3-oxoacyl-[acyl-carrier-protein] synthase III C-terminal domain-containing protein [Rhizobium]